jgi:hypothetical protein
MAGMSWSCSTHGTQDYVDALSDGKFQGRRPGNVPSQINYSRMYEQKAYSKTQFSIKFCFLFSFITGNATLL